MSGEFPIDRFQAEHSTGEEGQWVMVTFGEDNARDYEAIKRGLPEGHHIQTDEPPLRRVRIAPPLGKPAIRAAIARGHIVTSEPTCPTSGIQTVEASILNAPQ